MKELLKNQILKLQNGSKLYGTATPTSDDDYVALFIEPPEYVFSMRKAETIPLHDRGPEEKNVYGDVDGIAYSLRHFMKLALDGNPSILCLLFARPEHVVDSNRFGQQLLDNKEVFLSRAAGPKFLGYMKSQLLRLKGEKKGHIPSRPELVEAYGYDTKYAMQVARLALQGVEYLQDGTITLPMSKEHVDRLLAIRYGSYSYPAVLAYLDELDNILKDLVDSGKSVLPDKPDFDRAYKLSQSLHEGFWRNYG